MKKGTYVGLRVLGDSTDNIYQHCIDNNIPVKKQMFEQRLHTTLIYSRVHCPKLFAYPGIIYRCEFKGYELFSGDHGDTVLVALLNAPDVVKRHNTLMAEHPATYDYPVYNPHITLSYNFEGDIASLPPIDFTIFLGKEYVEEIKLDWEQE